MDDKVTYELAPPGKGRVDCDIDTHVSYEACTCKNTGKPRQPHLRQRRCPSSCSLDDADGFSTSLAYRLEGAFEKATPLL